MCVNACGKFSELISRCGIDLLDKGPDVAAERKGFDEPDLD
jgi:hypothetical protein